MMVFGNSVLISSSCLSCQFFQMSGHEILPLDFRPNVALPKTTYREAMARKNLHQACSEAKNAMKGLQIDFLPTPARPCTPERSHRGRATPDRSTCGRPRRRSSSGWAGCGGSANRRSCPGTTVRTRTGRPKKAGLRGSVRGVSGGRETPLGTASSG
jgi:hypothetical protein